MLQSLNSILKALAASVELVLTSALSFLLLGIPLYFNTVIAVVLISSAVVIYAKYPVVK